MIRISDTELVLLNEYRKHARMDDPVEKRMFRCIISFIVEGNRSSDKDKLSWLHRYMSLYCPTYAKNINVELTFWMDKLERVHDLAVLYKEYFDTAIIGQHEYQAPMRLSDLRTTINRELVAGGVSEMV